MLHTLLADLLVRPLAFALLVGLTFAPLEALLALRTGARRSFATDLTFATVGQVATRALLTLGLGAVLASVESVALLRTPFSFVGHPGTAPVLDTALALLLFELAGYAYHRLAHRVPALWRLHEVHHSSEAMDWLAAFRQHPLEIVLMTLTQNLPLVLLGIPRGEQLACVVLLKVNTVFVHANLRLPRGFHEQLVATPRFHHRHHECGGESRKTSPRSFRSSIGCSARTHPRRASDLASHSGFQRPSSAYCCIPFARAMQPGGVAHDLRDGRPRGAWSGLRFTPITQGRAHGFRPNLP